MNNQVRTLKQLIADGLYVVDERAVAEAILARAGVRAHVANISFQSEVAAPQVRSFRRDEHARSFHLQRRSRLHH